MCFLLIWVPFPSIWESAAHDPGNAHGHGHGFPLLELSGYSNDEQRVSMVLILAHVSGGPFFSILLGYTHDGGSGLPAFPFVVKEAHNAFELSSLKSATRRFPARVGPAVGYHSVTLLSGLLRSPQVPFGDVTSKWCVRELTYDLYCLRERSASLGDLLVTGFKGDAVRLDVIPQKMVVKSDTLPPHLQGLFNLAPPPKASNPRPRPKATSKTGVAKASSSSHTGVVALPPLPEPPPPSLSPSDCWDDPEEDPHQVEAPSVGCVEIALPDGTHIQVPDPAVSDDTLLQDMEQELLQDMTAAARETDLMSVSTTPGPAAPVPGEPVRAFQETDPNGGVVWGVGPNSHRICGRISEWPHKDPTNRSVKCMIPGHSCRAAFPLHRAPDTARLTEWLKSGHTVAPHVHDTFLPRSAT